MSSETGAGERREVMSFKNKKSFFEQEIDNANGQRGGERKFSYLQDHEVDKLKTEDGEEPIG